MGCQRGPIWTVSATFQLRNSGSEPFAGGDRHRDHLRRHRDTRVLFVGTLDQPRSTFSFEMVEALTRRALGRDERGERAEFLQLVALARNLDD